MKKVLTAIAVSALIFSASMAHADIDLGIAAGIAYPHDIEKFSFDGAASVDFKINPLFSLGVQTGFNWVRNDISSGDKQSWGGTEITESLTENIYTFPLLLNATFIFPVGQTGFQSPVTPFLTVGAGYAWSFFRSDGEGDNQTFKGLAYQAITGVLIDMGPQAQGMKLKLEAGYRGTDVKASIGGSTYELPMSSWIARVGVVFNVGGRGW